MQNSFNILLIVIHGVYNKKAALMKKYKTVLSSGLNLSQITGADPDIEAM